MHVLAREEENWSCDIQFFSQCVCEKDRDFKDTVASPKEKKQSNNSSHGQEGKITSILMLKIKKKVIEDDEK